MQLQSTNLIPNLASTGNDAEAMLIDRLHCWGICYLSGGTGQSGELKKITDQAFLCQLATCQNTRVRDALISLLLLHPELASSLLDVLHTSTDQLYETLSTLTLATLYLQRLWCYRLTLAFGHAPAFPERLYAFLWQERALPEPNAYQGRWGLAALERQEQRRWGIPLTFQGDWQNQVAHLLHQEEPKGRAISHLLFHHEEQTAILTADPTNHEQEYVETMSMRPNVDRAKIEQFLAELGRNFRQAGRLYLVGGAALVHAGIRPGSSATTQDIDVEVASGDMYQVIGQLKHQLNINVEFASPGDFIPLPRQWQQLSRYAGRYGKVDVFYFDFYSIALSKIERGNARDLQDVSLLLQQGTITLPELDQAAQEVADQMGKGTYKRLDPQAFLAQYHALRPHLQP